MQKRGEPYWLPEDTDLALEWQAHKRGMCKGCGQPLDESAHEDATERDYAADDLECMGCKVLSRHRRTLSEMSPDTIDGLHSYVTRRGVVRG